MPRNTPKKVRAKAAKLTSLAKAMKSGGKKPAKKAKAR